MKEDTEKCIICGEEYGLIVCPRCEDGPGKVYIDPKCPVCEGTGKFGICSKWHDTDDKKAYRRGLLFWWLYLLGWKLRWLWYEIAEEPVVRCSECGGLVRVGPVRVSKHEQCLEVPF